MYRTLNCDLHSELTLSCLLCTLGMGASCPGTTQRAKGEGLTLTIERALQCSPGQRYDDQYLHCTRGESQGPAESLTLCPLSAGRLLCLSLALGTVPGAQPRSCLACLWSRDRLLACPGREPSVLAEALSSGAELPGRRLLWGTSFERNWKHCYSGFASPATTALYPGLLRSECVSIRSGTRQVLLKPDTLLVSCQD